MKEDRRGRTGFTLVELLIVIAVIAIFAALILPALASAKEKSRAAACKSNLRQIRIAHAMAVEENSGRFGYLPSFGDGLPSSPWELEMADFWTNYWARADKGLDLSFRSWKKNRIVATKARRSLGWQRSHCVGM